MHLREWLVIGDAQRTGDMGARPVSEGFRGVMTDSEPSMEAILQAEAIFWLEDRLPQAPSTVHALASARLLFINAVDIATDELPLTGNIVRINAWPGFLRHPLLELAAPDAVRPLAEAFLRDIGWAWRWVADIPGMASPRILSMIINEACHGVREGVSDSAGIDRAMRLGASYPGGPFEWSRTIGSERIAALLERLALSDDRYRPAPGLRDILGSNP
jgi:hypothetical protein